MERAYSRAAAQREAAVEAGNDEIRETNELIGALLAEITGAKPSSDPNFWREWWHDQNDAEIAVAAGTLPGTAVFTGVGELLSHDLAL